MLWELAAFEAERWIQFGTGDAHSRNGSGQRKILAVAVILGKREKKEAEKVFEDICVRTKIAPIVTELEKIFDYFPNV